MTTILVLAVLLNLALAFGANIPNKKWLYPEEDGGKFQGDMVIQDGVDNGVIDGSKRWSNAVVPYKIGDEFSAEEKSNIMAAFEEYHKLTCVRFVERTNEGDYISIDSTDDGCWSYVGKTSGQQIVNLERPGCLFQVGTIVHELMHALGFHHEQSRTDRDDYVEIQWDNIQEKFKDNFEKYGADIIHDFGVEYDYESIMHYSDKAFTKNNEKTVVPKASGVKIGNREGLSKKDIEKINKMYECSL